MKTIRAIFFTILTLSFMQVIQARAAVHGKIECHTPRMKKSFVIFNNKVSFLEDTERGRMVASAKTLRTKRKNNGFTKILHYWGQRHEIHVGNVSKFSELNDYLTIRTAKGHEITYPLTCNQK
ncbi:hypothetical protein A9Q84_07755 [Halobacteriovorax marinus]|uniref:Secreted protein n=1 Tax=Halobacteriovorax marinus TaxID=97084 RepID=A0A1Y5F625_9BACT|nr:hypothetical protein A9Q84_07755 [Halobacteriovorax marinus]